MGEQDIHKKLISDLLEVIEDKNEVKSCIKNINPHVQVTLNKCLRNCWDTAKIVTKTELLEIQSILDYINDEMNIGHWSDIPLELRRVFTVTSFVKVILSLKFNENNITNALEDALKCLDRGLLMGAPLETNEELLTQSATLISNYLIKHSHSSIDRVNESVGDTNVEQNFKFLFDTLQGTQVDITVLPSLETFNNVYFSHQRPAKLQGCIDHWPARAKWKDVNYLLEVAGQRTVPIEIGTQYVDENWYQKLMTVREFIQKYYSNKNDSIGYLAQHNLFDQIPELRKDICIPDYCSLSENYENSCDPDINCWFGPAGTVSSLHYDPKNNLLAQVYGTKQVLLFSPDDSEYLYPYEGTLLRNTSQVDPIMPNLEVYPQFAKATMFKCLLKEGEVLFIPKKWWHHVIALEKSFSVSFWWE